MNIKQICSQVSATNNRLDIELLLAKAMNKSRVYLHSHPEENLSAHEVELFQHYCERYQQGEPVAYILGSVEFYSLNFFVTASVLIPRPETELLVDYVLEYFKQAKLSVLELGTGSGVIAISIAKHRPEWTITAVDVSEKALEVAQENARVNGVHNIKFIHSDWYKNIEHLKQNKVDLIVSNPPYVAENDPHLKALRFEPSMALVSGVDGLDGIRHIITEANRYLKPDGCVVLEHGYNQQDAVQQCFKDSKFSDIKTRVDLNHQPRVTIANRTSY